MHLSIGKSSLARAAAINARPTAESVAQQATMTCREVAVASIAKGKGKATPTEALVRSIGKNGIIEPLLLAQTAEQELVLVSGARRLAAAKELGLDTVPAVIVNMTAQEATAARREIARFVASTETAVPVAAEQATSVGQAMPAWLL